jgi:hypothetical protein
MFIVNTSLSYGILSLSYGILNSKEVKTNVKMNKKQQVYCCENAGIVLLLWFRREAFEYLHVAKQASC